MAQDGRDSSDDARLARHVPDIAIEWLGTEPDRRSRVVDGTLCFADISGFTALSERLARRGRIGAEELVEVLSRVFGGMLDGAAEHGGQLVKFGGDALLFLFHGDGHAPRAAGAAAVMRGELSAAARIPTSVGRLRLSMSVGLHSGAIDLFLVGDTSRELVVMGPAVDATIGAEHAAQAGQILVTRATAGLLPAAATQPLDGEHALLRWRRAPAGSAGPAVEPTLGTGALRSLVPQRLADVLATSPEPGHRIATVAFIRFSGGRALLAAGGDVAARALEQLMGAAQAAFHDEHVTLLTIDIDSDGGKIFCLTGMPSASEDDEGRMLRALRRILATPMAFQLQAGVNRGHVFAAELGTARRAAYSAMGDTTNTAARIAGAAPIGALYAHPSVLEHARILYTASPVGPFRMKGKSEPLALYEVGDELGPRRKSRDDILPMAGRADEVTSLRAAVDAVGKGRGGVVTVTGPAGLGKSRLVAEALRAGERVPLIRVRAEPYGLTTPYRPLRDPARQLLGVERGDPAAMASALLDSVARLAPDLLPYAPLVGAVASVEVPPTPETMTITDRHRPDRTADVIIELLRSGAPGPLVMVMEDAQWVDESTSHVLQRLASATAVQPWLLIVTRRDTDGGFTPGEGQRIELGPLPDDTVRALTHVATEATPLRPHEIDAIVSRADGSPLFIEELARALRTLGFVESVPESIHAALAAQLDSLGPPARRVLAYAAVLGRSFRRQVLFDVLEADGFDLDAATRAELDLFFDRDGETRVRFRNGLLRDVAYEAMAYRRRVRIHAVAAETLERISDDRDSDADMLAHHFWQAGDAARTWEYSRRAAERSRHAYANAAAAAQLERALDAARRLPTVTREEMFAMWVQLGDLRERTGLLAGALDAYDRAGPLGSGDPTHRAELLLRRAQTHERAGSYSVALRVASRARAALAGRDDPAAARVRAEALAFEALLRQRQEHAREALRLGERAMEASRGVGARSAQARASNVISWAATMLGRADAGAWARRSLSLYEAVGDLDGQADLANNLGIQAYFEGRWSDTLDLYRRSRDACTRVGNVIDAAATDANIAEVLVNQRRWDEARPLLRDATRVLRASGHRWGAAFAELQSSRVLIGTGRVAEALPALEAVRDQFATIRRGASVYETSLHLASCLTRLGRPDEALHVLRGATKLTGDDISIFEAAHARFTAEALIAADRIGEAGRAVEAGIAVARARGLDYELGLLLAAATTLPFAVVTGGAEPASAESSRVLARLGVVPERVDDDPHAPVASRAAS